MGYVIKWINMTNMMFRLGIYDLMIFSWINISFTCLNQVYMKLTLKKNYFSPFDIRRS